MHLIISSAKCMPFCPGRGGGGGGLKTGRKMFNQYSKPILKGLIIYGTFFYYLQSWPEAPRELWWNSSQIQVKYKPNTSDLTSSSLVALEFRDNIEQIILWLFWNGSLGTNQCYYQPPPTHFPNTCPGLMPTCRLSHTIKYNDVTKRPYLLRHTSTTMCVHTSS